MQSRECTKCCETKTEDHFGFNGKKPDGTPRLRSICRSCGNGRVQSNTKPKICRICKKKKPASEFRRNGTYPWCKPCQNERGNAPRRVGGEKHEWAKQYAQRYKKTDPLNNKKASARTAVYLAILKGILVRPARCPSCNRKAKVEAHHHNGYEKEHHLDVLWRCPRCHYKEDHQLRDERTD